MSMMIRGVLSLTSRSLVLFLIKVLLIFLLKYDIGFNIVVDILEEEITYSYSMSVPIQPVYPAFFMMVSVISAQWSEVG